VADDVPVNDVGGVFASLSLSSSIDAVPVPVNVSFDSSSKIDADDDP
jgi:hypothetical protein